MVRTKRRSGLHPKHFTCQQSRGLYTPIKHQQRVSLAAWFSAASVVSSLTFHLNGVDDFDAILFGPTEQFQGGILLSAGSTTSRRKLIPETYSFADSIADKNSKDNYITKCS